MTTSTYRVIYADTDQMGVVYHANYLALFERGRCEYMRARSFDYAALEREGSFLPVAEAQVKYRAPARFDDLLTIEAELVGATRASLTFGYRILRDDGRGVALLCEGTTMHVCTNRAGRPVRMPPAVRALVPEGLLSGAACEATQGTSRMR